MQVAYELGAKFKKNICERLHSHNPLPPFCILSHFDGVLLPSP